MTSLSCSRPAVPGQDCSTSCWGFKRQQLHGRLAELSEALQAGVMGGPRGTQTLQDCWQRIAAPIGFWLAGQPGKWTGAGKEVTASGERMHSSLPSQLQCPRWQPDPRFLEGSTGTGWGSEHSAAGQGREGPQLTCCSRDSGVYGERGGIYLDHEGTFRARN